MHSPMPAAAGSMWPPRVLQRPILISVSASRWKRDMFSLGAWPSAQIVLISSQKGESAIPFLTAVADPSQWPSRRPAALGASILHDLHAAATEAIAEIAARQTGMPVLGRPTP